MNSIRKKLLRWLLIGQLLAVSIAGILTFVYVRSEIEDMFDDRLRQIAYGVPTSDTYLLPSSPELKSLRDDDDDIVIQIWTAEGRLLLQLNHRKGTPELAAEGFGSHWSKGQLWRSFVLRRGDHLVQVSQSFSARLEVSTDIALGAIVPALMLVMVLGVLVWVAIGRGLRPLGDLASALKRRHPYSLEPLTAVGYPDEIRPLVTALNELLKRLDDALEGQRKFIADAAHELRTPLTAVQLQAQLLQRATEETERQQALIQIRAGTARAGHLVHQLLTLARMAPEDRQRPVAQVDLSALMKSVVGEHAAAALNREIDLGVIRDEPLVISGDAESLRVMLGNLVDNAVRYTPPGGRVDVSLQTAAGFARFEVTDTGKGIPSSERSQVFARFYRRPGTKEVGSGLGLAIVREVVDRHGGRILLDDADNGSGLKVVVDLPLGENTRALLA